MKKIVLTLIAFVTALLISVIAFVVRVKHNFEEMDREDINEVDYVYFEYDGIKYTVEEALEYDWDSEELFAVCLDYTFKDGDIFSARMDTTGTTFWYTILGQRIDITGLMHTETKLESNTVFEHIEDF